LGFKLIFFDQQLVLIPGCNSSITTTPPHTYTISGTYQPLDALTSLNGTSPNGTWILTVYDVATGDGGAIEGWGLEISTPAITTTYYADKDGDGYGDPLASVELGCTPTTGFVPDNTDCDDTDPDINPGATEVCDGLDNNCNGQIDEGNTCCPSDFVTYTATPVNGGLNPTYEWFKNGISVGATVSYTFNPLDGDEVYVVMTTSVQCYTDLTATSNTITMQVTVPAIVSVSVRATRSPGGQVKFTAYPVNGGATPGYQWYKNGNLILGATDAELISTCQAGDEHWVVLTSSLPCTTPATSGSMCTY
jgi:hypothetical protein